MANPPFAFRIRAALAAILGIGAMTPAYCSAEEVVPHDRQIYFDRNRTQVPKRFIPVIEAHGKYLLAHPDSHIVLIGHTDALGTREYNLAVGLKRAEMVKEVLQRLGVAGTQVETVTYGDQHPVTIDRSVSATAKNRRVDMEYPR